MATESTKSTQSNAFALVTGASGGIGLEFARQLAAQGWNLMLAARRFVALKELATELESAYGIQAIPLQADLSLPGAAEELFAAATARGPVGILVNNAGIGIFGLCEDMASEDVQRMVTLNCTSLTVLSNLFARHMKARGEGYILNVSSVAGNWPEPFFASYAATKAYVTSYSAALSCELRKSGVSVSCLLPGFVATSFDDNARITSSDYKSFSGKYSLNPAQVARIGLSLMFRRKYLGIAGFMNKVASFFNGLMPRNVQAAITWRTISKLVR